MKKLKLEIEVPDKIINQLGKNTLVKAVEVACILAVQVLDKLEEVPTIE